MYKNFEDAIQKAKEMEEKLVIVVSMANEKKILTATKRAVESGMCEAILVGDKEKMSPIMKTIGFDESLVRIVDVKEEQEVALEAVKLVNSGEGHVLVKGIINSSDFLRSVLDKTHGLRTDRLLCTVAIMEVPGTKKLQFNSCGGMVIAPDLLQKKQILENVIPAMKNMGIEMPKVALLCANEKPNKKMIATLDAVELVKMAERGELPEAIYEGPIAFDVAVNPEAARAKGIESKVSGDVDLYLMPNIETGNCVGKAILFYGKGKMAGLVLGARNPIVMPSRAETVEGKLASIAFALLAY
jgi:phosphate butyryltransferase